jgi:ribose transport system permease protein
MTTLLTNRKLLRALLPVLSLAIVLVATFYAQPRAMSYFGLNLMLQYAVPIALATVCRPRRLHRRHLSQ